tara:strand:+ start:545 stop:1219 length:675 start_codon:yes stop_codon:yes gene_type:complete
MKFTKKLYLCRNQKKPYLILSSNHIAAAIALPFIAGSIGWFTNYLAVKMLFHPRKPVNFLGVHIQGVFPKRQSFVAEKIGQIVANDLLASDEIFRHIQGEGNLNKIKSGLSKKLSDYFELTFAQKYPMASRLLPKKAKIRIQEEILEEVEKLVPSLIQSQVYHLEDSLDIESIITSKVNQLSGEKLEKLLWDILAEEFKFIEWVGAILGFTIGLIQVALGFLLF